MIQLIVNTNMLRELDERRLINTYARLVYNDESDTTDDNKIKENLKKILDWNELGARGLEIYCGKYEKIKRKDWVILINFIKDNAYEIKNLAYSPRKKRRLSELEPVFKQFEERKLKEIERLSNENYKVSGRGKKARPCEFEGRHYKSRLECQVKEGITNFKLQEYLKKTGQL